MALGVTGTGTRQGPLMPSMQWPGRGLGFRLRLASTQTFRILNFRNTGSRSSTRKLSSLQHHPLAHEAERNPLMAGETKVASNTNSLVAREAKITSDRNHLEARESKFSSNDYVFMPKEAKIASSSRHLMAEEAEPSLMAYGAKVASNGKEVIAIKGHQQTYYQQQLGHVHVDRRPIRVAEGRGLESRVSRPGHIEAKNLHDRVLSPDYLQHCENMDSRFHKEDSLPGKRGSHRKMWLLRANDETISNTASVARKNTRQVSANCRFPSGDDGSYFQVTGRANHASNMGSFQNKDVSGLAASQSQATCKVASEQSVVVCLKSSHPSDNGEFLNGNSRIFSADNKDVSRLAAHRSQTTSNVASEQSFAVHHMRSLPSDKEEFHNGNPRTFSAENVRAAGDKTFSLQYNPNRSEKSISQEGTLLGTQTKYIQSKKSETLLSFRDLNSHREHEQSFPPAKELDAGQWRQAAEKYRVMKKDVASASVAGTQPLTHMPASDNEGGNVHNMTSPASGKGDISSVSKTGHNADQSVSSHASFVQEGKLKHLDSDKVRLHFSPSRQVESKEMFEQNLESMKRTRPMNNVTGNVGICYNQFVETQPGKLLAESKNQNREKEGYKSIVRDNKDDTSLHCSPSRQVGSKKKFEQNLESMKSTGPMNSVTGFVGICHNRYVETHPDKPLSKSQNQNGEKDNYKSRVRDNEDNTATINIFTVPNDGEVSASNQVATEVSDCKGDNIKDKLNDLYKQILVVDKVKTAKEVVGKLMGEYRNLVHACDTEVADIDVKKESPVGHGNIICFSIYCGSEANFGKGKSCLWVDVLDGGDDVLSVFAPYFEDSSIRKVFHNYSFDRHIIANHGIHVCGFYADTMHLARLWNSARRDEGGYSLEALTKDPKVMDGAGVVGQDQIIQGKVSMKTLFGKRKLKKDGTEGKTIIIAPVEDLQRTDRMAWICYSALDSISTWKLWKSLKKKLKDMEWIFQGDSKYTMYDFYEEYWRPFGELLVRMESKGMLVDREYLSKMEEVANREQEISASSFKNWASTYCPDAKYMNVCSDAQVRQLLFGGMPNKRVPSEKLPMKRSLKVPNADNFIEEGKKLPSKFRNIVLLGLGVNMEVEHYTESGWPAVSSAALKGLAGKVSINYDNLEEECENELIVDLDDGSTMLTSSGVKSGEKTIKNKVEEDLSIYGTAYNAFGGGERGRKACQAIAALCEVSSINTLISNFLQPLQGNEISGKDGRVHCSLNINTETGRLSARNPNLQNQPALEKDRYKIRQAFIASPGNSLIVADYGQLELRILAHLSNCKSMLDAFKAGGDFHSRTAMNMYPHVRDAVEKKKVLLEWDPQPGEEKLPIPLLKDVFASERRKAKMLNFSIAYGKTAIGLSKDWKVTLKEAKETVDLWYNERKEVLQWQEERKHEARTKQCVYTLLGRPRHLPCTNSASSGQKGHIERAAINTPVQGSAADVAMCAMLEISRNARLEQLGWTLVLQVHDEVILEGPTETAEEAKALVVDCMSKPFYGQNILRVDLAVDAKYALNWYAAK